MCRLGYFDILTENDVKMLADILCNALPGNIEFFQGQSWKLPVKAYGFWLYSGDKCIVSEDDFVR